MLKTQGSLLLALTLSALLMTFCGNQESGESDSSFEGIVIDEANVPLRGAIVRAEHLETGIATVVLTDPGGNFWTPPLTEGQYEIRVGKKGFRPYGPTTIDLNGDTDALEVNLVSFPTIPTSQLTDADILPHLPEDDGKMELFGVCTSCHNFETILSQVGGGISPYRCKIRSPSFINLTVLKDMLVGWKLGDLIIIFGSVDVVMGEVDR